MSTLCPQIRADLSPRVCVQLPEGARPEPASELPRIDVPNLPGAALPLVVGYRADRVIVRALCATAPSSGWAPGLEEVVLGRATAIAKGALGFDSRLDVSEPVAVRGRFEQGFVGGGEALAVRGKHLLGFAGEVKEALLCTVVCTEPAGARSECAAVVDSVRAEGTWEAAPAPNLLVRSILLAAEHPRPAGAAFGAAILAAVALVLARRPRPRSAR